MAELLSFEIGNFRSFYEPQRVDFGEDTARLITALYGPNASGKSNVIKALATMVSCILNSASANWILPYEPFLLREGADSEPTRFTITFSSNGRHFKYGFSYDRTHVVGERLLERSAGSRKMRTVFSRDGSDSLNSTAAKNGFGKKLYGKTRPETLLITKAREDNNEYANLVFELLSSIVLVGDAAEGFFSGPMYVEMLKQDAGLREKTVELMQRCDIAIRDIRLEAKPLASSFVDTWPVTLSEEVKQQLVKQGTTEFKTVHALRDDELTVTGMQELDFWYHESAGTRKFFEVAVPIISAIENGQAIFIDEFSSYIHPGLAKAILGLFRNQAKIRDNARLVFVTHDTSMMSGELLREEIILVEKTLGEETRLKPLVVAGARKDEPFEKRYLSGYYGALPFIRD